MSAVRRGSGEAHDADDGSVAGRWEAMRHLYFEHHPKLLRFVARRVGGRGEAEDVCQEIWRVFYVKYDDYVASYEDAAQLLYPIARYRISDFWQQKRGWAPEAAVEREDLVALAEALREADDEHQQGDRRVDIERALLSLPPRQREALYLRYVDDLPEKQTATLMGVSVNTVKKYLKEAKGKLRTTAHLDSYGLEYGWEEECE